MHARGGANLWRMLAFPRSSILCFASTLEVISVSTLHGIFAPCLVTPFRSPGRE
ncbi:hypothetical protein CSUI_008296 [Cystoisospora suis]|uniref:Uncharacterized protein n=1 Tax=Cystoisospora suis TaxID=483139 RepID=A0A2C6JPH2_9APIC|nr:hypothetical protein CSUI_008296 [Cystoisospora suis]